MGINIFKKVPQYTYPSIISAYEKIRKCIDSSNTLDQLNSCSTMVSLFRLGYSIKALIYVQDLKDKISDKELKIKLGTYGK